MFLFWVIVSHCPAGKVSLVFLFSGSLSFLLSVDPASLLRTGVSLSTGGVALTHCVPVSFVGLAWMHCIPFSAVSLDRMHCLHCLVVISAGVSFVSCTFLFNELSSAFVVDSSFSASDNLALSSSSCDKCFSSMFLVRTLIRLLCKFSIITVTILRSFEVVRAGFLLTCFDSLFVWARISSASSLSVI